MVPFLSDREAADTCSISLWHRWTCQTPSSRWQTRSAAHWCPHSGAEYIFICKTGRKAVSEGEMNRGCVCVCVCVCVCISMCTWYAYVGKWGGSNCYCFYHLILLTYLSADWLAYMYILCQWHSFSVHCLLKFDTVRNVNGMHPTYTLWGISTCAKSIVYTP